MTRAGPAPTLTSTPEPGARSALLRAIVNLAQFRREHAARRVSVTALLAAAVAIVGLRPRGARPPPQPG